MIFTKDVFFTLSAIALVALTSGCKKNSSYPIDVEKIIECYQTQNFDSTTFSAELIGSWKLMIMSCFWTGEQEVEKNVVVNFNPAGTFWVMEDSIMVTQGHWTLEMYSTGAYELDLNTSCQYLHGQVFLCDDEVLSYNSPVDGCDNLFVRLH